ncbi:ABC-type transport auxiliary lipoprotein family protein [Deefgea piscis]|uniref:ABC-type transport auxiliary lipoprotein family protein n=1 Tax=Deefgea piscis TaxID=2739061 RepID=UPI001C7EC1B4|nr:ABC-type transport auxiliary lipoprotein family protein [Deefgea piscis]QZA80765.1 PqiC family protein [Deefgea piscis]
MKTILTLCCISALLFGCSSTTPPRKDFLLSNVPVSQHHARLATPHFKGSLQVQDLHALSPYRSTSLIYRESAQRFVLDPYNGFLAPPAQQISSLTREALAASGLFTVILPLGSSLMPSWRLEGELQQLYVDVTIPAQPRVTLSIRYALSQVEHNTPLIFEFTQTEAIVDASPEQAVIGFNRALNTILLQLESSLLTVNTP